MKKRLSRSVTVRFLEEDYMLFMTALGMNRDQSKEGKARWGTLRGFPSETIRNVVMMWVKARLREMAEQDRRVKERLAKLATMAGI